MRTARYDNTITATAETHANDELLTLAETAAIVRVPEATLRYWRHIGEGPHSFRVGRCVRYWHEEVLAWLELQSENNASSAKPRRFDPAGRGRALANGTTRQHHAL